MKRHKWFPSTTDRTYYLHIDMADCRYERPFQAELTATTKRDALNYIYKQLMSYEYREKQSGIELISFEYIQSIHGC